MIREITLDNKEKIWEEQINEKKHYLDILNKKNKNKKNWQVIINLLKIFIYDIIGVGGLVIFNLNFNVFIDYIIVFGIPMVLVFSFIFKLLQRKMDLFYSNMEKDIESLNEEIRILQNKLIKAKNNNYQNSYDLNNWEEKGLLETKMKLIQEYNRRKKIYQAYYDMGMLNKIVNNHDDELVIRQLILNEKNTH